MFNGAYLEQSVARGQRVIIAPFSPTAKALGQYLQKRGVEVVAFADAKVRKPGVSGYDEIADKGVEKVLICSPAHAEAIYKQLRKRMDAKMLEVVYLQSGEYKTGRRRFWLRQRMERLQLRLLALATKFLKPSVQSQKRVLCLGAAFVDNNVKDFACTLEQRGYKAVVATDNAKQQKLFAKAGFHTVLFPSFGFVYHAVRAATAVLDHTPTDPFVRRAIEGGKTVQLWHGIPLKQIGRFADYKKVRYDLLLSTSPFVTEYAFSRVFNAEKIIECGYPRNEIFFTPEPSEKRLVLADKEIYGFCRETKRKIVVYMPTYRNNARPAPIDFADLDSFAGANGLFFIIKLHPFVLQKLREHPGMEGEVFAGYEHLYLYPEGRDIYPILPLSSMLITDYSSVYFDYLLLDKPILFFVYDLDDYEAQHGAFMLDFESVTPGQKVTEYGGLKKAVLEGIDRDQYAASRKALGRKLFVRDGRGAGDCIISYMRSEGA